MRLVYGHYYGHKLMPQENIHDSLEVKLGDIPGWLAPEAAAFTTFLFSAGLSGNVLEFGVFQGKYLALLYALSAPGQSRVLGVDVFIGARDIDAAKKLVTKNVREVCGDADRLSILSADISSLTRTDVLELLPEPIAFISVDAGHEAHNLINDINLSAEIITYGGIIAVDDAFNFSTPGAIEGTCEYFSHRNGGRLAPFAHCYNKLFLTTASDREFWLDQSKKFVRENQSRDYCARTLHRMEENQAIGFVPRFFGYEIVPFL